MIRFFKLLQYYLYNAWLRTGVFLSGFDYVWMYPGYRGVYWSKSKLLEQKRLFWRFPKNEEIITASAIMDLKGNVWAVMMPGRHHHCIRYMAARDAGGAAIPGNTRQQGFMTNTNRFIRRPEARKLALANGQANQEEVDRRSSTEIFSEEIWDTPTYLHWRERP